MKAIIFIFIVTLPTAFATASPLLRFGYCYIESNKLYGSVPKDLNFQGDRKPNQQCFEFRFSDYEKFQYKDFMFELGFTWETLKFQDSLNNKIELRPNGSSNFYGIPFGVNLSVGYKPLESDKFAVLVGYRTSTVNLIRNGQKMDDTIIVSNMGLGIRYELVKEPMAPYFEYSYLHPVFDVRYFGFSGHYFTLGVRFGEPFSKRSSDLNSDSN